MTKKQQLEQVIKNAQAEISDINRDKKSEQLVDNVILSDSQTAKVLSKNKTIIYNVDYIAQTCDCEDHYFRQTRCKHIRAVNIVLAELQETAEAKLDHLAKIDSQAIENTQALTNKSLLDDGPNYGRVIA